ncbi:H(+)-transporting V1 sector ATPase subunit G [Dissophora globulifera]|uniref:V-type proton ATPase subunit G n=1 Tax=Dissophora globulifera TaxID=979702 RepID=A0A9P6UMK5_9FUNG|nr:H(+)-transporting V1 sector ATPase subunit G [Dissophora globulifera]KAG0311543.1 H(+)-transporting V1 sector ATPase subunit G [Dissophora globulifera]
MAASNSTGIQTLLEAEKEAAKIVQKARQYRVQRLKDARAEAAKEIDELKVSKNEAFKNFEQEHAGSSDQTSHRVEVETEQKRVEIEEAFAKNREAVLQKLLETVYTVEPKIHRNARISQ